LREEYERWCKNNLSFVILEMKIDIKRSFKLLIEKDLCKKKTKIVIVGGVDE
jgi:hypothetical protein